MREKTPSEEARYIKIVNFDSVNDIPNMEAAVNAAIENIKRAGGKIVSIVPHTFGFSPVYKLYDIIYQADHAFTAEELGEATTKSKGKKGA